jgi:hypothetical protein
MAWQFAQPFLLKLKNITLAPPYSLPKGKGHNKREGKKNRIIYVYF